MATASPQGKPIYLYRLLTLTIDQGNIVVRTIFDEKISNVPLHQFLHREKKTIKYLRYNKKIITKVQYDVLFPQSRTPTTADLDLTLLVSLLRNLNVFGLNCTFNWNAPPQPGDTSLEADIRRLQMFRNKLAHISSTNDIDVNYFNNIWNDIEQVLNRLNWSLQTPVMDLQTNIDNCKSIPDTEEQELIVKRIHIMQSSLESEVQDLRKDVDDQETRLSDLYKRTDALEKQNRNEETGSSAAGKRKLPLDGEYHQVNKIVTTQYTTVHTHPGAIINVENSGHLMIGSNNTMNFNTKKKTKSRISSRRDSTSDSEEDTSVIQATVPINDTDPSQMT